MIKMVIKPNTYVINGISNGAIWAVFIELQVYLLAAVFRKLLIENRSRVFWLSLFSVFFAVNVFSDKIVDCLNKHGMEILAQCYLSSALPYMYFFLIGVIAFKFFDDIVPVLKKNAYILVVVFLLWHVSFKYCIKGFSEIGFYTDPITVILSGLSVLGLAYRFGNARVKMDLSYGIFVWHMPVVTFLSAVYPDNQCRVFILALVLTLLLTVVSQRTVMLFTSRIQIRIIRKLQ